MKLIKISALVLALVMALAMSTTAFATSEPANLTNGEIGGFTSSDSPISQEKTIKIAKELTVYNKDETSINAPTVSYSYTVTAGAAGVSITDATTDHTSGTAITVQTKAGVLTGLKVNNTSGATGTISWASTETVTAADGGAANLKYLNIGFSDVVFGAAGVYRYVITETPPAYAASGVTETTNTTNPHVRYLDVYVRPATSGFTDGTHATDWDIYGYVCMLESEAITPDGDTTSTGAVKTNGFVAGTNDGTAYLADSYYTFNVTVSKTVSNDGYAAANHLFPFTVIFTNSAVTQDVDIIGPAASTDLTGWTNPASSALSAGNTKGIVNIKHDASVKYIGIPNGTSVEVYETNDVTGVTYLVTTVTDGVTPGTVDPAVTPGTTPTAAVAQASPKEAYQSTKATITTTADADDDTAHTVAVNNNLQVISPTGVVLRVAPYLLMLAAGIALLVIFLVKRKKHTDEE